MVMTRIRQPTVGPDRRAHTRELVHKLVAERTQMLVLFCRAAGLGSVATDQPVEEVIREFCQVLVDYVAAGHFTLYERIASDTERRRLVRDTAARVYPELEQTTQAILDFNDSYQEPVAARNMQRLSEDLSRLGEQIAIRIELEDQILSQIDPSLTTLR